MLREDIVYTTYNSFSSLKEYFREEKEEQELEKSDNSNPNE